MKRSLVPTSNRILVEPLYDPDTVETGLSPGAPGLFMPDSAKNPMSQQGIVLAVGPEQQDVEEGDHVLYHPFIGTPIKTSDPELLLLEPRHLVGFLAPDGVLWPLPDYVVLRPDFRPAGRPIMEGHLWIPKQVFSVDIPCTGVVVRRGARVSTVTPGQRVLFPTDKGNEIGLRQVWYTIRSADLLAIVGSDVAVTIQVAAPPEQQDARI